MFKIMGIVTGGLLALSLSSCAYLSGAGPRPKHIVLKTNWIRTTLQSEYTGYRRLHRMKPLFWRESVISGNSIDGLISFDQQTGKQLWSRKFAGGVGTGGTVGGDRLFIGSVDGQFYALSVETGETLWSYPIRSEGVGEPLVHDGHVYFLAGNHILHALRADTGQKVWTYNRQIRMNASVYGAGKPAIKGSVVYLGFSDGHFVALDVKNGSVYWDIPLKSTGRFRDIDTSPIIDGDMIYTASFDGALFALDLKGNVLWQNQAGAYNKILIQGQKLFYSSSEGDFLALDKKSGKILWRQEKLRGVGTGPVFHKNLILVGETQGDLMALNPNDGKVVARYSPGRGVSSQASVAHDGSIYFASVDANLFSMEMKWKSDTKEWPWENSGWD